MKYPELPYRPEILSLTLQAIMLNVIEAAHSPAVHVTHGDLLRMYHDRAVL